jgi:sarcosine oxidase
MWAEIEHESGEKLYTRTGGIDFGAPDEPSLNKVITTLQETNIPFELMSADEAAKHFPQFRFNEDTKVLYQGDAGILPASKCVLAHLQLAEKHGAILKQNTPILSVAVHPDSVEVKTANETYSAAKLVIAAGSWAKSFLAMLDLDLPLTPCRCQEMYFNTNHADDYEIDRFPAFIAHLPSQYKYMPYGMASNQGSGLKVAWHGGQLVNHPSEIDYTPSQQEADLALQFGSKYLPDMVSLRASRVCLYTMTPDEHWIIDKHPQYSHVVFAGGCSGHAFKFSTIIGKILSDLATVGQTEHDISLFKVSRFL